MFEVSFKVRLSCLDSLQALDSEIRRFSRYVARLSLMDYKKRKLRNIKRRILSSRRETRGTQWKKRKRSA